MNQSRKYFDASKKLEIPFSVWGFTAVESLIWLIRNLHSLKYIIKYNVSYFIKMEFVVKIKQKSCTASKLKYHVLKLLTLKYFLFIKK